MPPSLRVAAIIPAFNEADRIVAVLEAIAGAPSVDEIICVTDGCTDDTARHVEAWLQGRAPHSTPPARLLELAQNLGKGGAMAHGAHHTDAEILLFLDADLIGLKPEQVEDMLAPMKRAVNPADMTLGLFGAVRGGVLGYWLSWCHRATPSITGQRAIRRDIFLSVPGLTHSRFGVEAAITCFVQSNGLKVENVYIHSVTHPIKEEKLGLWRGARNRVRMYCDIFQTIFRSARQQNAAKNRARRERILEWFDK